MTFWTSVGWTSVGRNSLFGGIAGLRRPVFSAWTGRGGSLNTLAMLGGIMLILGACASEPAKPSTARAPVETPPVRTQPQPAPEPAPVKPAEPSLPAGLASGFGGLETRSGDAFRLSQVMLSRPELAGAPPVRIALLVPLSGPAAGVGEQLLAAAQMALFDAANPRLVLMPKDTAGSPEGAQDAARTAIAEGASLIVGPLFGAHIPAVRAEAAPANIPVIAFSNDVDQAGNGAYLLGLTPASEVEAIVGYALQRGHTRIAAFLPDSDLGVRVYKALDAMMTNMATAELSRVTFYPAGAEADDPLLLQYAREFADYDLRAKALEEEKEKLQEVLVKDENDPVAKAALERLEKLDTLGDPPFDAVLLAEPARRLPTIAPLLAFNDVDPVTVRYLGLGSWYAEGLEREPTLIGGWFPGPDPGLFRQFESRFQQQFDQMPQRVAALGYDAIAMAAALTADAPQDPAPLTTAALLSPDGFAAYYGAFRLTPSGVTERLLPILEVAKGGLRVSAPARPGFAPLLN